MTVKEAIIVSTIMLTFFTISVVGIYHLKMAQTGMMNTLITRIFG